MLEVTILILEQQKACCPSVPPQATAHLPTILPRKILSLLWHCVGIFFFGPNRSSACGVVAKIISYLCLAPLLLLLHSLIKYFGRPKPRNKFKRPRSDKACHPSGLKVREHSILGYQIRAVPAPPFCTSFIFPSYHKVDVLVVCCPK